MYMRARACPCACAPARLGACVPACPRARVPAYSRACVGGRSCVNVFGYGEVQRDESALFQKVCAVGIDFGLYDDVPCDISGPKSPGSIPCHCLPTWVWIEQTRLQHDNTGELGWRVRKKSARYSKLSDVYVFDMSDTGRPDKTCQTVRATMTQRNHHALVKCV